MATRGWQLLTYWISALYPPIQSFPAHTQTHKRTAGTNNCFRSFIHLQFRTTMFLYTLQLQTHFAQYLWSCFMIPWTILTQISLPKSLPVWTQIMQWHLETWQDPLQVQDQLFHPLFSTHVSNNDREVLHSSFSNIYILLIATFSSPFIDSSSLRAFSNFSIDVSNPCRIKNFPLNRIRSILALLLYNHLLNRNLRSVIPFLFFSIFALFLQFCSAFFEIYINIHSGYEHYIIWTAMTPIVYRHPIFPCLPAHEPVNQAKM